MVNRAVLSSCTFAPFSSASCIRSAWLISLTLISCISHAQQGKAGNEAYFANDIDEAVADAKRNPIDTRYVGSTWYNRSTSKSFGLPKMLNTEMDSQVIEGAVGATAAGDNRAVAVAAPQRAADLGRNDKADSVKEGTNNGQQADDDNEVTQEEETYIRETSYSDENFTGSAREIRARVRVSARIRN